ncbi:MAG: AAA family ATPase [Sedimentibacter sp.]|uniref:ATP-binding protein n=1 Tax=Sedimentibacter sp. TaxID=1960295 RepID=UPI0031590124
MYINKLHLRAFGKFSFKKLYFGSRFNIVYGENEAGKSTIHNFIEAMLYGFEDGETGQEKYNKYKPWIGDLYRGSLGMSLENGEKYVVSRDFLLGTTQVFKKESSDRSDPEMVEEEIDNPGEFFLNMSKTSFRNTVSVRQLGNKTEQELARELKNKIINLSSTRDQSISIERIISRLKSIREEAGSEDNGKTLLGQYSLRLAELKAARENSLNASGQVMFLAMEKKKLRNKINELDMRMDELKTQLRDYELSKARERLDRAQPVKAELEEIKSSLARIQIENSFSKEDFREAENIERILQDMSAQKQKLLDQKQDAEENLKSLESHLAMRFEKGFSIDTLNEDYANYMASAAKISDMKAKILSGYESLKSISMDEILNFLGDFSSVEEINKKIDTINVFLDSKDYEAMKRFKRSQGMKSFFLFLLGTVFLGGGAYSGYYGYTYGIIEYYYGAAGIIPALMLYVSSSRKSVRARSAKNEIEGMECSYADYSASKAQLEAEKDEIIKKSGCGNFGEMTEICSKKTTEKNIAEEKMRLLKFDEEKLKETELENKELAGKLKRIFSVFGFDEPDADSIKEVNEAYNRRDSVKYEISELVQKFDQLVQNLNRLDKEASFEEKRLEMILASNGMDNLENFKKAAVQMEKYEELIQKRDLCETTLSSILENEDFEELKEKTKGLMFFETKEVDEQKSQLEIFRINDEKTKLNENVNNIHKEIADIESGTRSLAEIEEEIDFYEDKISTFKRKIEIADMAAEKIINISDSIKGDFMPLLKKSISDNFSYLTGGKYCEVAFDEDMNITVIAEDNKDMHVELESLSGGTLDQLYLSLRVGLSSILSNNMDIPLIFDDSFVQYDTTRLKKSIEMLSKESERRQVILFTCQEREAETAKQMNVKFNYIKL